jgi:hypothetical protein
MGLWRPYVSDVLHLSTSEDCDKIPVLYRTALPSSILNGLALYCTWGYEAQQDIHRSLHTIAAPQPKTD